MRSISENPAPLWPYSRTLCIASAAVVLTVLMILRQVPQLDVAFSLQFFTEQDCGLLQDRPGGNSAAPRCGQFLMSHDPNWKMAREIAFEFPRLIAALLVVWLLWLVFFRENKTTKNMLHALLGIGSVLIGPILIVNLMLKSFWGRPRPFTTLDFGSQKPFVLPGTLSDNCDLNCSFVSGEAAAAFWLLWIVPCIPKKWRWPAGVTIMIFALATSLLRVAFGRHYLSDVVVAALISFFSIALVGWFLQRPSIKKAVERWCNYSNSIIKRRKMQRSQNS